MLSHFQLAVGRTFQSHEWNIAADHPKASEGAQMFKNRGSPEKQFNEISERFHHNVIATVQTIVRDSHRRLANFQLSQGVFYPSDYGNALKAMQKKEGVSEVAKGKLNERYQFLYNGNYFLTGFVPKDHLRRVENETAIGGYRAFYFTLNEGSKPSQALSSLRNGLCLLGCAEICQMGIYQAWLTELGEEKFNAIFQKSFHIGLGRDKDDFLGKFFVLTGSPKKVNLGDIVGIRNAISYIKKHPRGECGAYYTICIDNTKGSEKYIGLGLNPNGATLNDVSQRLYEDYHRDPVELDHLPKKTLEELSATLKATHQWQKKGLTMEEFQGEKGGTIYESIGPKVECVQSYKMISAELLSKQVQGKFKTPVEAIDNFMSFFAAAGKS